MGRLICRPGWRAARPRSSSCTARRTPSGRSCSRARRMWSAWRTRWIRPISAFSPAGARAASGPGRRGVALRAGRLAGAGALGPASPPSADALRTLASTCCRAAPSTRLHPYTATGGERALAAALEIATEAEVRVAAAGPGARRLRRPEAPHPRPRHRARRPGRGGRGRHAAAGRRAPPARLRCAPSRRSSVSSAEPARPSCAARWARRARSTFVVGGRGEDVDGLLRRLGRREDNRVYLVESLVTATVLAARPAPRGGGRRADHLRRRDRPALGAAVRARRQHLSVDRRGTWTRCSTGPAGWPAGSRPRATPACSASTSWSTPTRPPVQSRALLAEVHPRVDGATYPLAILQRLNATQRECRPAARAPPSSRARSTSASDELRRLPPCGRARSCTRRRRARGMVPYEREPRWARARCGVVAAGRRRATRSLRAVRRAPDLVPRSRLTPCGPTRARTSSRSVTPSRVMSHACRPRAHDRVLLSDRPRAGRDAVARELRTSSRPTGRTPRRGARGRSFSSRS